MTRAIGVLLGLAALSLVWVATAQANGGPHGGYTATTDGCAGCHRTHTATSPKLLINTNTALCLTCHGTAATGADTNVNDGVYEGTTLGTQNAGLNGGGFTNVKQDTSLSGSQTSGAVTSIHTVQGMPGYSNTATMWGAGAVAGTSSGSAGAPFDLYCTSCHDAHGSPNYRMLRTTVNGVAVTVAPTDDAAKSYTAPHYYAGTGQWQISGFCAACHTRYQATAGASGETSSGDFIFSYRHRIDAPSGAAVNGITYAFPTTINLPVSSTNGAAPTTSPDNRSMVCVTCHFAHGSKAVMGANSGAVAWPGGATTPAGNARSSLLRIDNRGVCESCHAK
jgi:predicted CXXCH cytochrome family protein